MEYTRLGRTGLRVSRIALGCMTYGAPRPSPTGRWTTRRRSRSSARPSSSASPSGTPRTSTARARRRRSSAARSRSTPAARTSCSPPRSTSRWTTVRAARACPARRSWSRSTRRCPARHRLRRPLPDPPLRPGHPGRGDDGGAARRRQGRQGPLPRGLVDVGLAVRQDAARRRPRRLDPVRLDAEPVQPAAARGGARDVRPARRPGRRARSRGARSRKGRLARPWGEHSTALQPSNDVGPAGRFADRDEPDRRRRPRIADTRAASPWRRSRSPGCCATRSSPPRSSARPSRTT